MTLSETLRRPSLPAPAQLSPKLDRAVAIALAAYGFFLPFSVAGTNIILGVLVVLACVCAGPLWRSRPWREPVMAVGLVLLAWIVVHTVLVDGPGHLRSPTFSYKELLVAPLLLALFRLCSRPDWFLRALVAGTFAWAAFNWQGVWSAHMADVLNPSRISAGFEFALLAYLLLEFGRHATHPWRLRLAAAFLAITVLFAMDGRTGQLVLLVLLALAAWMHSPPRWRVAALVLVPLLVGGLALGSGTVQRRMAETIEAVQHPAVAPVTSTEIRLEFVHHGLTLAREHWLLGAGYTHYADLLQDAVRRAYADDPARRDLWKVFWARTPNPHDEYVMQLVSGGVVSLALFVAWLATPVLRRAPDGGRSPALLGAVLAFALGCLVNSLLMDFVEAHYYTALLAWLLARDAAPRA